MKNSMKKSLSASYDVLFMMLTSSIDFPALGGLHRCSALSVNWIAAKHLQITAIHAILFMGETTLRTFCNTCNDNHQDSRYCSSRVDLSIAIVVFQKIMLNWDMSLSQCQHLPLSRWLGRPSTWIRIVWMLVAVLHGWLILRRLAMGDYLGVGALVKMTLCLAAIVYTSLKFWKITTIFDDEPRRALVFALALLVGHWAISPPVIGGRQRCGRYRLGRRAGDSAAGPGFGLAVASTTPDAIGAS